MPVRVVSEVRPACRRGLHVVCVLTALITRWTGRYTKPEIVEEDGDSVCLPAEKEYVITGVVRCTCLCHVTVKGVQ